MAKRMINTSIWRSKQVSNLSIEARLLFVGLITFGDDDGRLNGDPALLRSMVFSRDEKVTVTDVAKWLEEIVTLGLVLKYAANGDDYLVHPHWGTYQTLRADRKKESNVPPPPDGLVAAIVQPTDNQPSAQDKTREGKLRKEKVLGHFEAFWKEYPNKTSKKKAMEIWLRIFGNVNIKTYVQIDSLAASIIQGLSKSKQSSQWTKDGGKFIPHPTTWLNQERWADEGLGAVFGGGQAKTHKI